MGVNKVILLGRLGKDPELRYTSQQTAVSNFSLATGERRKDSSGNWVEHTEWHTIVVFGRTAENCANYLKKGREVYIEGRIQTRKWQDKEGRDRYTTEVIANTVQFLGSKGEGAHAGPAGMEVESNRPAGNGPTAGLATADAISAAPATSADDITFDDDDIPF